MGKLFDSWDAAEEYQVQPNDTLARIAASDAGKHLREEGGWKAIARFNWATIDAEEVNRALVETVGVHTLDEHEPQNTILDPDSRIGGTLKIPKLVARKALAPLQTHELTIKRRYPPVAIEVSNVPRWFVPSLESCDIRYRVEGLEACANTVDVQVHASHYCKVSDFNDGFGSYEEVPEAWVFREKGLEAPQRTGRWFEKDGASWKGESNAEEGMLSMKRGDEPRVINVAFSPYTVVTRYRHTGSPHAGDDKAHILIDAFWPQFNEHGVVENDSLTIRWQVKESDRLEHGLLKIEDAKGNLVFVRPLAKSDLTKSSSKDDFRSFDWSGAYNHPRGSTSSVSPRAMPYRVYIEAHTPKDTRYGLALAACHTEVRLYVHPKTLPTKVDQYDPERDAASLQVYVGRHYNKPEPPAPGDRLFLKYALAEAGFNPGPVSDAARNDYFDIAIKEFQRAVPVGNAAPFSRQAIDPDAVADPSTLLESLNDKHTRPPFSLPDRAPVDHRTEAFRSTFADPKEEVVVWIDDRQYYSDPHWIRGKQETSYTGPGAWGDALRSHIASLDIAMGNTRHGFTQGNERARKDKDHVARPWIPLNVDLPLMPKDKGLDAHFSPDNRPNALLKRRRAIGPLRVDWTVDEIDGEDIELTCIDNNRYHRRRTRTREALTEVLNTLGGQHDCNEPDGVTRASHFHNARKENGGLRDHDHHELYYKQLFGHDDKQHLLPWRAEAVQPRESVATIVHDDLGQAEDELYQDVVGVAGVYFVPSRMAGDGYRVRAQVRFEQTAKFQFPNLDTLKKRYAKLPQCQTARLRNWRRTSMRSYLDWSDRGGGGLGSNFEAHYHACHVDFVREQGAQNITRDLDFFFGSAPDLDSFRNDLIAWLPPGWNQRRLDPDKITPHADYIWPWTDMPGMSLKPATSPSISDAYREWTQEMGDVWTPLSLLIGKHLVAVLERETGLMRGHTTADFTSKPHFHYQRYRCWHCGSCGWLVGKANNEMLDQPCPWNGCPGSRTKHDCVYQTRYACGNGHANTRWGGRPEGGEHAGARCSTAACGAGIQPVTVQRTQVACTRCRWRGFLQAPVPASSSCPTGCGNTLQVHGNHVKTYSCSGCGLTRNVQENSATVHTHHNRLHTGCASGGTITCTAYNLVPVTSAGPQVSNRVGYIWSENDDSHYKLPAIGLCQGVALNFNSEGWLWAHEIGHNRWASHAANAPAGPQAYYEHDSVRNNAEDPFIGDNSRPEPVDPKRKQWDRACVMSYVFNSRAYHATRDVQHFCALCVLRMRGWNLDWTWYALPGASPRPAALPAVTQHPAVPPP